MDLDRRTFLTAALAGAALGVAPASEAAPWRLETIGAPDAGGALVTLDLVPLPSGSWGDLAEVTVEWTGPGGVPVVVFHHRGGPAPSTGAPVRMTLPRGLDGSPRLALLLAVAGPDGLVRSHQPLRLTPGRTTLHLSAPGRPETPLLDLTLVPTAEAAAHV